MSGSASFRHQSKGLSHSGQPLRLCRSPGFEPSKSAPGSLSFLKENEILQQNQDAMPVFYQY